MFRRLQLSSKKLKELYDEYEYTNEEILKLFGHPPYEFLGNQVIFARNFGKEGATINNPINELNKVPDKYKKTISISDIGKYVDQKGREYLLGNEDNIFYVKLPKAKRTELSSIGFPELEEVLFLKRRDEILVVKVIDLGNGRKATAAIEIEIIT